MYWEIISIVGIALVRCCVFGFKYFPVIDDWIQYGAYQSATDLFNRWFLGTQLYYTRPLAALMDLYVWGKIGMSLSFLIITILLGVSCWLFLRFFRSKGFNIGLGFVIIYMLLPINSEGTMWLSASTRIVVPLFLTALSLNLLDRHKWWFAIVNLLSLFFYEQTAIVSLILAFWFAGKYYKIIPVANGVMFAIYYKIFSGAGSFGERSSMKLPDLEKLSLFWEDFAEGFFVKHWQLIQKGFLRGGEYALENFWLILLIGVVTYLACAKVKNSEGKGGFVLGIVLFVLPLTPYLVVAQSLSFRAFMPSLVGLGLIMDGVLRLKNVKRLASGALIPVFLLCGISEVVDYRSVSLVDKQVATELIETQAKSFKYNPYPVECNAQYAQHITSVTESNWATTGCIRCLTGDPTYPMLEIIY